MLKTNMSHSKFKISRSKFPSLDTHLASFRIKTKRSRRSQQPSIDIKDSSRQKSEKISSHIKIPDKATDRGAASGQRLAVAERGAVCGNGGGGGVGEENGLAGEEFVEVKGEEGFG
ncbi:hypothetical protein Droror1_Dr00002799 [Drosera rotundifolia]